MLIRLRRQANHRPNATNGRTDAIDIEVDGSQATVSYVQPSSVEDVLRTIEMLGRKLPGVTVVRYGMHTPRGEVMPKRTITVEIDGPDLKIAITANRIWSVLPYGTNSCKVWIDEDLVDLAQQVWDEDFVQAPAWGES